MSAPFQAAEQQFLRQRLLDGLLNDACQRPGTELGRIALVGQPGAGRIGQGDGDITVGELGLQLQHELVDHPPDHFRCQGREGNDRVQTVAELRREQLLDRLRVLIGTHAAVETDGMFLHFRRAGIGGHDQHDIAEIDLLAVVVGQLAVVHDLQQQVEDIRMRLLDLVEQQHGVRVLVHVVRQQPALVEADIARRRTDQAADGVALHVFRHVEAVQRQTHGISELLRRLRLADTGRAGEQVGADGLLRFAQTGTRKLHCRRQRLDGYILAEDDAFQVVLQVGQDILVLLGHRLWRNAGNLGNHGLHIADTDDLLAAALRLQHFRRADLIDHVDGLVGQFPVIDVAGREFDRRTDRIAGVADLVMLLVVRLQTIHDLHRILDRRLVHVDLLEPSQQGAVLLEVAAIFLIGGGPDATNRAGCQRGLQQVRCIHGTTGRGTGPDDGVDLVDEQDRVLDPLDLPHHCLQPFLEITPIPGSGQQRTHVECVDRCRGKHIGDIALHNAPRQPFRDGGLADTRFTHIQRIVLGATAEDLDGPVDLQRAPDQRIDLACPCLLVQIDTILRQRLVLRCLGLRLTGFLHAVILAVLLRIVGTTHGAFRIQAGGLGNAMADIADGIETGHVLLLQEIGGMALPLREDRDQDIGACHFLASGGLHMDQRPLHHTLETQRRLGVFLQRLRQILQILVNETGQFLCQLAQVDVAGAHHRDRVRVVDQTEQQMLQRRIFMIAFTGQVEGTAQGFFEMSGERWHASIPPSQVYIAGGAGSHGRDSSPG